MLRGALISGASLLSRVGAGTQRLVRMRPHRHDGDGRERVMNSGVIETIWDLPGHQVFVVKQEGTGSADSGGQGVCAGPWIVAQRRMTVRTIEGLVED